MKNKTKILSNKSKLGYKLALCMTALIGIMCLFVLLYVTQLINEMGSDSSKLRTESSDILAMMLEEDLQHNNYLMMDKINKFISKDNDSILLKNINLYDLKTGVIKYSTQVSNIDMNWYNLKNSDNRMYSYRDIKINSKQSIGFIYNKNLTATQKTKDFKAYMNFLLAWALFLGFVFSLLIAKILMAPINELVLGTKEFTKGNLSYRIKSFNTQEIDELADAYNTMADAVQQTYASLELQIEQRTQQLNKAYNELKSTQAMMVHSEKMRALGELVAGITHEINNPVNFIYGNLIHLTNYVKDLFNIIEEFEKLEPSLSEEQRKYIDDIKKSVDLEFLREDTPNLLKSCMEGTERTKNIVFDLKDFSRMEEIVLTKINLAKEIDTTLNILKSKFKNRITIHKEYEPNLPEIEGYGGQLNQVFMNILDNASYAIKDTGDVYVRLKKAGNNVIIEIEDTGSGMDKETAEKIFNPFFTTKPIGQGTGLGMSISYNVLQNHNGKINVKTELGQGTTFIITLPIKLEQKEGEKAHE